MSAVSNKTMSQEDLLLGMQVFDKPHHKAKYLARALLNGVASVEDVAQIAFKIDAMVFTGSTEKPYMTSELDRATFGGAPKSTDVRFSLVLPILFHMKTKGDSLFNKEVIGKFRDQVNEVLGKDHVRRLATFEHLKPRFPRGAVSDFINQGLEARTDVLEKAYFLANVIIGNLEIEWKREFTSEFKMKPEPGWKFKQSSNPSIRCHDNGLEERVMELAFKEKMLVLYLTIFLEVISGDDKVVRGHYSETLEKHF